MFVCVCLCLSLLSLFIEYDFYVYLHSLPALMDIYMVACLFMLCQFITTAYLVLTNKISDQTRTYNLNWNYFTKSDRRRRNFC